MKLSELLRFDSIIIQCHDNPDADALASGYGLYLYFKEKSANVRFIYSGYRQMTKSNLLLMTDKLEIPIEYVAPHETLIADDQLKSTLLITVDCQYGASNVSKFKAENVAIIDHHKQEITDYDMCVIVSNLGGCATLVWQLLREENFDVRNNVDLSTALYYGLYMDTDELAEMYNPVDRDMLDDLNVSKVLVNEFRNSNLSLEELEIVGVALLRFKLNMDYRFAVLKAHTCDANILGIISDSLLQVDVVDTCAVYMEVPDGYKFSIRSCIREVNAADLASYLVKGIGSGGGHYNKAGGFASANAFSQLGCASFERYVNDTMISYFENYDIIDAKDYEVNLDEYDMYKKVNLPIGCVKLSDIVEQDVPITIRTLEADIQLVSVGNKYALIGVKGEVYPNEEEKFLKSYKIISDDYDYDSCVLEKAYSPKIINSRTGDSISLKECAKTCVSTGDVSIYAKKLEKGVKVFTAWSRDNYFVGNPGDYLAVRTDDLHDIYVIEGNIFKRSYKEIEE